MTGRHGNAFTRIADKFEITESGCWEWTASKYPSGYGAFFDGSRVNGAHRILYELVVEPIPNGLQIDHLCRNRGCINPDHLEVVTPGENTRRGSPARKTHCPQGHEYSLENTHRTTDGHRHCRACDAARHRRYRREAQQ